MSSRSLLIGAGVLAVLLAGGVVVLALVYAEVAAPAAAPKKPTSASGPAKVKPPPPKRSVRPITPREVPLLPLTQPRILVEKGDHRLTVFDGERLVKTYRVAVGEGRLDKTREGDKCTPEGIFYVCVKNPKSRFKRGLGLSYPNIEDARRGLRAGLITRTQHDAIVRAIRKGARPPWDTPLGGEIVIHGAGDGREWTKGCIALDNADILELYPAIGLHTPVKIVP